MRSLMRAFLLAIAVGSLAGSLVPQAALADTGCAVLDQYSGECVIGIKIPGTPGEPAEPAPGGGSGAGGGQDAETPAACVDDASYATPTPVECARDGGYWSNERDCYVSPADPQPPAGDPAFGGHPG